MHNINGNLATLEAKENVTADKTQILLRLCPDCSTLSRISQHSYQFECICAWCLTDNEVHVSSANFLLWANYE